LSLWGIIGMMSVSAARGPAYHKSFCNQMTPSRLTCFIPSIAISEFIKNNPGTWNHAMSKVLIQNVIRAALGESFIINKDKKIKLPYQYSSLTFMQENFDLIVRGVISRDRWFWIFG
jgi:hypothetical protein